MSLLTRADALQPICLLYLMLLRPPISTLFPYTTLFRSIELAAYVSDEWAVSDKINVVYGLRMSSFSPTGPGKTTHPQTVEDRKSTRLNSSHGYISYAVFCMKKKSTALRRLASRKNPTRA